MTLVLFGLFFLFMLGASDMFSVVVRQPLIQLETPDHMRGRVSAVNSLFIGTSNQIGEFESGVTAAWFGTVPAVVVGGAGTLLIVLSIPFSGFTLMDDQRMFIDIALSSIFVAGTLLAAFLATNALSASGWRRPGSCSRSWGSPTWPSGRRAPWPMATAAALRWLGPWPQGPPSCCSMNPLPALTPRRRTRCVG